jgi:hypothetical protein
MAEASKGTIEAYVRVWTADEDTTGQHVSPEIQPQHVADRLEAILEKIVPKDGIIGSAILHYDARTPAGRRPQLLIGFRGESKPQIRGWIDQIVARRTEVLWNLFPQTPTAVADGRRVAYVFVTQAPPDYPERVRDELGEDDRLHFLTMINEGPYEAFSALAIRNDDEAADLVDHHFGSNPAGGQGVEIGYGGTYLPQTLKRQ